jgi:transposase InsO family protein
MCECLNVGRSGYYHWLATEENRSRKADEHQELSEKIKVIFIENKCRYGSRRIRQALLKMGYRISKKRVAQLMREQGLYCKTRRKFKYTTDSNHDMPIAPNLLNRDFSPAHPDKVYVGDITYIPTHEGWLYLAVVIDLFSRRVVGWAMSHRINAALVNKALLMALWTRKPKRGLLWHTDRGSQYASKSHRDIIKNHGIIQSMSRKGDCWDNAVSESFFHTLKVELIHHEQFKTRGEAQDAIFEYIEIYYNRKRMHSVNNYLSPDEFENARKIA